MTKRNWDRKKGHRLNDDLIRLRERLADVASGHRMAAFGVADLAGIRERHPGVFASLPDGFSRAVVMGYRLQDASLAGITDRPTPLYFHHYRQANFHLDRTALAVADGLIEAGWEALAVPASQVVSRDPMRGMVSHRVLGYEAGLGWIGRSTLLVNPRYGARLRYVSVLTDAPIPADRPGTGGCGSCRACARACPAGAIGEASRDYRLDLCYAKLTEFTKIPFVGQHICGVCVKSCRPGEGSTWEP